MRYQPKHLKLWVYPQNYSGTDFSDYYPIVGQCRDSDVLAQSNWATALDLMGGESKWVVVSRAGHWAVGWVEELLVHKNAPAKLLRAADELAKRMEEYLVLDESDYSEREYEYYSDYAKGAQDELAKALRKHLPIPKRTPMWALKEIAYQLNMERQYHAGPDSCIDVYPFRVPDEGELRELAEALERCDHNLSTHKAVRGAYAALLKATAQYRKARAS
jgi:hypothetical protein